MELVSRIRNKKMLNTAKKAVIVSLAAAMLTSNGCSNVRGNGVEEKTNIVDFEKNGQNNIDKYLKIVNKSNDYDEDNFKFFTMVPVKEFSGKESFLEEETYKAYVKLKEELARRGINAYINSAGRTLEDQEKITQELLQEYGQEYVDTKVAKPGQSEHHTGLAIDIKLIRMGNNLIDYLASKYLARIDSVRMFDELHSIMQDYGFIWRYEAGKEDITGYSEERWHIRYVGSPEIAKAIKDSGLCLEEYVSKLYEKQEDCFTTHND